MILINIPFAVGWIMLFEATEVWHVFFGFGMLGFGAGVMRAPMAIYIGNTTSLRHHKDAFVLHSHFFLLFFW